MDLSTAHDERYGPFSPLTQSPSKGLYHLDSPQGTNHIKSLRSVPLSTTCSRLRRGVQRGIAPLPGV
jgi:hypothetical protein